jgi:hypothetical protein
LALFISLMGKSVEWWSGCFVGRTSWKICIIRAGVHAPIKSLSLAAPISFFPPVKPRSAVHTDRQNRYRRLQGAHFRKWVRRFELNPSAHPKLEYKLANCRTTLFR